MAMNGCYLRGRAPQIECKMRANRPAANGFDDRLAVAVPDLHACQASSSQAFDLLGRRVQPANPYKTGRKTVRQASETNTTGELLRISRDLFDFPKTASSFLGFIHLPRGIKPGSTPCYWWEVPATQEPSHDELYANSRRSSSRLWPKRAKFESYRI